MVHRYDIELNNQIFKKVKASKPGNEQAAKLKYTSLRKSIINGFQTEAGE